MNEFLTWDSFLNYVNFTSVVFLVVEFTKELKIIKKISTKYWSFFVALSLLIMAKFATNTFYFWDITLYILSSMAVSLSSNGLSDFCKK